MGIGDEVIASGHAKTAFEKDGRRVMIVDAQNNPRWSAMWEGLPWIAHPVRDKHTTDDLQLLKDGPRCRPYIDYKKGFTRRTGINFTSWRVRDNLGAIHLTESETSFAAMTASLLGRFTIIEPLVKTAANPNKQWGRNKWAELAALLIREGMNPIQIGPPGIVQLPGVRHVITPDFRLGVALMRHSRWNFLPDGGLHHAAGALGLPATVLWGGTNDPDILGYPVHENIYFPRMCGAWMPCLHCQTIWKWLTPAYVWERTLDPLKVKHGEDFRSR